MFRPLIIDLAIVTAALLIGLLVGHIASAEPVRVSVGTGIETRYATQTNSDLTSVHGYSEGFAKIRWNHWAVVAEFLPAWETHDSSSGSYSVSTETSSLGAWARYEFFTWKKWTPYADLGAGEFFDHTTTQFQGQRDDRDSRRGFISTGGGLTATFWHMFVLDGELRAASVQQRDDFTYSLFLRAGLQI